MKIKLREKKETELNGKDRNNRDGGSDGNGGNGGNDKNNGSGRDGREVKKKNRVGVNEKRAVFLTDSHINELAKILATQIDKEAFAKKYAPAAAVLKLVAFGVFLAASIAIPSLPKALKPFLKEEGSDEYEAWGRFNIPYLKRTLNRLEKQKLVEFDREEGKQVIKITEGGKQKILKYAIEDLKIEKPEVWDGKWRLVSYDIPVWLETTRHLFRADLLAWGFYPLHESVFLHAYSCLREVEFLREYLGIGEYVRIFTVEEIENDKPFRQFFGI